jgi:hypothetical protein
MASAPANNDKEAPPPAPNGHKPTDDGVEAMEEEKEVETAESSKGNTNEEEGGLEKEKTDSTGTKVDAAVSDEKAEDDPMEINLKDKPPIATESEVAKDAPQTSTLASDDQEPKAKEELSRKDKVVEQAPATKEEGKPSIVSCDIQPKVDGVEEVKPLEEAKYPAEEESPEESKTSQEGEQSSEEVKPVEADKSAEEAKANDTISVAGGGEKNPPSDAPLETDEKVSSETSMRAEEEEAPKVTPMEVEEEEDDDVEDAFSIISKRQADPANNPILPARKKLKRITIKLQVDIKSQRKVANNTDDETNFFGHSAYQSAIVPDYEHELSGVAAEEALEKSLAFYAETHEDQDPRIAALAKEKDKKNCQKELENLALEDGAGRKEISQIVAMQLKEKQASADRNIERLRSKAIDEEQKDLQKLSYMYNEKSTLNRDKIQHGIKLLSRRHTQEMHKQAQQHRLNAQQRGVPEPMANAEWAQTSQQLQEKHRRQLQEFNSKGEEVKKKTEHDYIRERDKRRKHHDKRKKDMEHGMQKVISRMHQNFQQQHQRYLKRHVQRIIRKKNEIIARMNGLPPPVETGGQQLRDVISNDKEERTELRAPQPIQSVAMDGPSVDEEQEKAAAARHKHRKAILSTIPKQLGVEIHNEGLWVAPVTDKNEEAKREESKADNHKKHASEFIPWGLKARDVLHTIVCGEIPLGYGPDRFDFGDVLSAQGGCIRCVVTDLRTGETTASKQRAECTKEQEEEGLQDLERKVTQLTHLMSDADKNVQRAEMKEKECMVVLEKILKEVDKARKLLQDFRTKFGRFFGPGKKIKVRKAYFVWYSIC